MSKSLAESTLLISPFAGSLVDLVSDGDRRHDAVEQAAKPPSVVLSDRSVLDLEMLAVTTVEQTYEWRLEDEAAAAAGTVHSTGSGRDPCQQLSAPPSARGMHLSRCLGFSKEDRGTNIRRIGFAAAEIVRHGGTVLCAVVRPYRATRNDVRRLVGANQFVEVFVDTPLEVCEARDREGLYARARPGEITGFIGFDDAYERPEHPEIVARTVKTDPQDNAFQIVQNLARRGLVRGLAAHS